MGIIGIFLFPLIFYTRLDLFFGFSFSDFTF